MGGGSSITTVGLGTWLFSKPNTRYYASPYLVGGAALLAGSGLFSMQNQVLKKWCWAKNIPLNTLNLNKDLFFDTQLTKKTDP